LREIKFRGKLFLQEKPEPEKTVEDWDEEREHGD